MHSVEVKHYAPSDYTKLNFRDKEELKNLLENIPNYFNALHQICNGNVYSIWKDDKIIIITGWCPTVLKYAEMFLFASEDLDKVFDKEVMKSIRKLLHLAKTKWDRLQTTCKNIKRNKRFLEFLGFKQECFMQNYGFNGEGMYLYALVKE